jgi:uncharacterized repeat protein (TIGR01451 family)
MFKRRSLSFLFVCLLASFASIASVASFASSDVVVSQVYGGGGNAGATFKNDFIEIFNRSAAPVSLAGWSVQYNSATGTGAWQVTPLSGTLQPGQYFLVQEAPGAGGTVNLPTPDASGAIAMSATAGRVALLNSTTPLTACALTPAVQDLIGYGTGAACFEGTTVAPTLSNTLADIRAGSGCTDTDANSADFATGAPSPRNSASALHPCNVANPTAPTGVGLSTPNTVDAGGSVLLTVTVTPGTSPASTEITVRADLSAIGGSAAQQFFDDGTNGDVTAGDNVFSLATTVAAGTLQGAKVLSATVSDAQGRSSTTTITLNVPPPVIPIHTLQGSGDTTPFNNQIVSTTGIVTSLRTNGFFIQTPDAEVDNDPATSEGVFVFTSSKPTVLVGDSVRVTGKIVEFLPTGSALTATEFNNTGLTVQSLSSGNPLPAAVHITAADLSPSGPPDQLERFEGMRVFFDSLTSVGPTRSNLTEATSTATSTGLFYAEITGTPRGFREPGIEAGVALPAGTPTGVPVYDGNPEIIAVDTDPRRGVTAVDVSSGAVLTAVTGVLDYTGDRYTLLADPVGGVGSFTAGMTATPVSVAGEREFTIASFNMERFYNDVNDNDGGVTLTTAAYQGRLNKASLAIINLLHLPDLIGIEEMENIQTLQDLAAKVNADAVGAGFPDPQYQPFLFEGNDPSAIDVAVLAKSPRVTVNNAVQIGKDTTFTDPRNANVQQILNDRPPLVVQATIKPPIGQPYPVTFIVNHLRSLTDVDDTGPTGLFVRGKRAGQAEFLANLIAQHQAAGEHVVSVGDYNAFQFNDGYVDVIGTILGAPALPGQVILSTQDLVDPDLIDLVNTVAAEKRYSYVETGTAQVLDHVIVTNDDLIARPFRLEYARFDADFPEVLRNDTTRPERVSDHDSAVAFFTFPNPKADLSVSGTASASVLSGQTVTYTFTVANAGPDQADNTVFTQSVPAGVAVQSAGGAGFTCSVGNSTVTCANPSLAANATAQITVSGLLACATANNATLISTAHVGFDYDDPNGANNTATFTTTVLNPPPAISTVVPSQSVLTEHNHKFVDIFLTYSVTDNCDAMLAPQVNITSNQAVNGHGDGNTSPDWIVIDAHHVQVRGERSNGDTRIYTIMVSAADSAGNASSRNATVSVR